MDNKAANKAIEWHWNAHQHSFRGVSREAVTEVVLTEIDRVRQTLVNQKAESGWIEYGDWLRELLHGERLPRDEYDQLTYWLQINAPPLVRDTRGEWFQLMRLLDRPEIRAYWAYRPLRMLTLDTPTKLTSVHKDNLRDLLVEVAELHHADTSVTEQDVTRFVNILYEDGWKPNNRLALEPPSKDIFRFPTPSHASVQAALLARDQPVAAPPNTVYPTAQNGAVAGRKRAHDAEVPQAPKGRRKFDPVYLRAFPGPPGSELNNTVQFQWHDDKGLYVNVGECQMMPGWSIKRAFLEAMRKWDNFQWRSVTAYNLAVAVYLARKRVSHWNDSRAVERRPTDEKECRAFVQLSLCQQRGFVSAAEAAEAFKEHCFDVPPPFMASWPAARSTLGMYPEPGSSPTAWRPASHQ